MEQLKKEYSKAINQLRKLRESMDEEQKKAEGSLIGGMISDLQFALDWMKSGRRPGNRRGVERLAAYQKEKLTDPILLQRYCRSIPYDPYEMIGHKKEDTITLDDKQRLEYAMSTLTAREKEIYLMSRGSGLTHDQIAQYLLISPGTVKTTIHRAEKKIAKQLQEGLFRQCG
ncbi:RNA polymerase sigma-70 factor, ECF subfamily [Aneurinibacillus thermoaerophilus]|uniref:RNA polymerase sigma-70 factor, ECF subfamily n=1 Tax=Aneurinibacillus thermoaerophilus TaxID=143495 RepID=A0A1G8EKY8_ANETH|nr:sigma-70 family RNA polymerase sigma factor [Aneurinibacillus thermoaerophilus]SDH70527.1 RNA polymerase sigma-70 factor, ECF subfamily [Aneurinibacillus thermoaerophilus]